MFGSILLHSKFFGIIPPAHLDALVRGDEAGAVLAPALLLVAGRTLPRPRPRARGLAGLVAALAGAGLGPQPRHARLLCTASILLHIGVTGIGNSVTTILICHLPIH